MSDVGLTHVALPVTNLDASIRFYASYAKLHVVHRREEVVWLSDGTRPFVIVLIEAQEVRHPLRPVSHIGVGCASLAELEQLCERARAEDVLVDGPKDYGPPVGTWAFLRDPDGHTVEISYGQEVTAAVQESDA